MKFFHYKTPIILLGILMLSFFIWFRFLRERLPREIPFHLSFFGMLILIIILTIYFFAIKSYFIKTQNITNGEIITDFLLIPLKELDKYIKSYTKILYLTEIFLLKLSKKYKDNETHFVIKFELLPKLILALFLFIDTFYYHKLFFIYKILLIGLLILYKTYIKYSIKYSIKYLIEYSSKYISIHMRYEYAIQIVEDLPPEDENEDDFIPETMKVPLKDFITYHSNYYIINKTYPPYNIYSSREGFKHYRHKKGYEFSKNLTPNDIKMIQEENKTSIENLLSLNLFFIQIKKSQNIIYLQIGLLLLTAICWLYILIVSLPNLYLDSFFYSLLETFFKQNDFDFQNDKNNYYEDDYE